MFAATLLMTYSCIFMLFFDIFSLIFTRKYVTF